MNIELSYAQERLWFLTKIFGENDPYKLSVGWELRGALNVEALNKAFNKILSSHEILRLKIDEVDGKACPSIIDKVEFAIKVFDLSKMNVEKINVNNEFENYIKRPMRLDFAPLIRCGLFKLSQKHHVLIIVIHHIIADGWSIGILKNELSKLYNSFLIDSIYDTPNLRLQYNEFIRMQRNIENVQQVNSSVKYWQQQLKDCPKQINIPYDTPRKSSSTGAGNRFFIDVNQGLVNKIKYFASVNGITPFVVFISIFNVWLHKYSNSDEVVIGIPLANRRQEEIENLIGLFVNVLPFRSKIAHDPSFLTYIKETRKQIYESYEHQDLPFEALIQHLNIERNASINPVFQIMFVHLDIEQNRDLNFSSINATPLDLNSCSSAFDITILVKEHDKGVKLVFEYSTDLFKNETIERMASHFIKLSEEILQSPDCKISNYSFLSPQEVKAQTNFMSKSELCKIKNKTIHQLFEEQVKVVPNNSALIYNDEIITYEKLNNLSNELANDILVNYKFPNEKMVGLCLDSGPQIIIAIFAILKAGLAYVPIDPNYPEDRIKYILEDTKVSLLITNKFNEKKFHSIKENCELIIIDDENYVNKTSKVVDFSNFPVVNNTDLANVIYTSGSTGKPKGVMIEHQSFVETIINIKKIYFGSKKKINTLSMTNYVFDVFGLEYALPLFTGGSIEIANDDLELIECSKYDFIQMTPSRCYLRLEALKACPNTLLFIGGENLSYDLLKKLLDRNFSVINLYGPTETTIWSTHQSYFPNQGALRVQELSERKVSIGKVLNLETVYVLDKYLNLIPLGTEGELYIGGIGLARGYLNKPDLTLEKFIENPFQTALDKKFKRNMKLYKTGDMVKWMPNGTLEFIGRNDYQVKIRGYRIELEEIENVLSTYEGITQCSVHIQSLNQGRMIASENSYIVGYYLAKSTLDSDDILSFLSKSLPNYMLPNVLCHLPIFPMTATGKIDKKALPLPHTLNRELFVAPRNKVEGTLRTILAKFMALNEEEISVTDDFFKLGGNSILAIQFLYKINKEFNSTINVSVIFKNSTIDKMADYLSSNAKNVSTLEVKKMPIKKQTEKLLSYVQERLWFIEEYEQDFTAYNIPLLFKIRREFNFVILEKSLQAIVLRHEILRSTISRNQGGVNYQCALNNEEYAVKLMQYQFSSHRKLHQQFKILSNTKLNLKKEIPIKFELYSVLKKNENSEQVEKDLNEYFLGLVVHHIAFDGWSINVFVQELNDVYELLQKNPDNLEVFSNLSNVDLQYYDFALWQRQYLQGNILANQLDYWKAKLSNYETLNLVTDSPRPMHVNYAGSNLIFEIDNKLSNSLNELAKKLETSLFTILLSGYYLLLSCFTNQKDIVVGVPIANRHYVGVENVIGCFVNTLALRANIDPNSSLVNFLKFMDAEIREMQSYQDVPFEKLVEELNLVKDLSRNPIFQVFFAMNYTENLGNLKENSNKESSLMLKNVTPKNNLKDSAKFDISFFIEVNDSSLSGNVIFAKSLFTRETIQTWADTYIEILRQISILDVASASDSPFKIKELEFLDKRNKDHIIEIWNATQKPYSNSKTIHQLYEEQAERTPGNTALIYGDLSLTYAELNKKANSLAHFLLKNYTMQNEPLITLFMERNEYLLVAILAILKIGGAYVPLDPNYNDERIKYIINDTKSTLIITNLKNANKMSRVVTNTLHVTKPFDILLIDSQEIQKKLNQQPTNNTNVIVNPNHLAYVLYTSGTTGDPKGVMLEHGGIVNRLEWMNHFCPLDAKDRILQKTPYVFDVSVWELFWANWHGAAVVIASEEGHKDPDYIIQLLIKERISIIHFVPSMLDAFQERIKLLSQDIALKHIFCSGEVLTIDQVRKVRNSLKNIKIYNLYGPTECSVDVSYFDCSDKNLDSVYIGKPIDNTYLYVLSEHQKLLPMTAVGELYIGGVGLSRGYLNKPTLTAEKFIENSLCKSHPQLLEFCPKLYKTGDLVRLLPNGQLEFLGRNDFQVKMRGFRIELGEIEKVLIEYNNIRYAIVILKESIKTAKNETHGKYLIGYYLSDKPLNEEDIYRHLSSKLPEYMVPKFLVHIAQLPLTINGKIDRKSLPEPQTFQQELHVPPRNELEKQFCQLWAKVLGLEEAKLGINDDFFSLGGDSIVSMQLSFKIKENLDLNVSIKDIFTYRTIAMLTKKLFGGSNATLSDFHFQDDLLTSDSLVGEKLNKIQKIPKNLQIENGVEDVFLANSLQQGFIYNLLNQDVMNDSYHVQLIWEYHSAIDVNMFEESWRSVLKKYPSLRLRFLWDDELIQVVDKSAHLDWRSVDLTLELNPLSHFESICATDRKEFFNLNKGNLLRIYFVKINNGLFNCVLSFHHAIMDGWSAQILIQHVNKYYLRMLTENRINYEINDEVDDCFFVAQKLLEKSHKNVEEFWDNYLQSFSQSGSLIDYLPTKKKWDPLSKDASNVMNEQNDSLLCIKGALYENLKKISIQEGLTLHSIVQFACHRMLHVFSNENQTTLGTIVSGRNLPIKNIEHSVGLYINTLPLMVEHEFDSEQSILTFIRKIQNTFIDINDNSSIGLSKLKKNEKQIFDFLFVFENYPKLASKDEAKILGIKFKASYEKLDYPLSFIVSESKNELILNIKYMSSIFEEKLISSMLSVINLLLEQVCNDINKKLKDINYVDDKQYQEFMNFSSKLREEDDSKLIHQLFEEQAEKNPNKIALRVNDDNITYFELNARANQLAAYLQKNYKCGPDCLIALSFDRNEKIIISILAILKTGSAYIPIDPLYPDERIKYCMIDSMSHLLITEKTHSVKLSKICEKLDDVVNLLVLDKYDIRKKLKKEEAINLESNCEPCNLAYIIYTSGTTGEPKGVLLQHDNVVRLFSATAHLYNFNDNDVWTLFHSSAFDFSVWEIWGALIYGGKLVIPTFEQTRDLNEFYHLCQVNKVTVLNQTPSAFYQFSDIALHKTPQDKLTSLKYVIFGGEALNILQLKNWFDLYGYDTPKLINMYGITETTVHVTYKEIQPLDMSERSNIGKVIPDLQAFILNKHLKLLPTQAVGELYIGGKGLARGYLNKKGLTSERFITNFCSDLRLYKTGDVVRWLPQKELEYIGRNDFQVKIRGHRIELKEIESVLSAYQGIIGSVAIVREHKGENQRSIARRYLVAYYLATKKINKTQLRSFLSSKLPDYMIPSSIVKLEKFPLTINGKIDIKALPLPNFVSANKQIKPATSNEILICKIWSEVLNIDFAKISMSDDFFKFGGDSIVSIRLLSRVNKEFDSQIRVRDIFELRTIAKLMSRILASKGSESIHQEYCPFSLININECRVQLKDFDHFEDLYPASYLQMGMLLESSMGSYYHNLSCYTIRAPFDEEKFINIWKKLINKHALLRASFILTEKGWLTAINKEIEISYKKFDNEVSNDILKVERNNKFDFSNPGLFKLIVNDFGDDKGFDLIFVFHHAIEDGWSMATLINEFVQTYAYNKKLSMISLSYGEFVRDELYAIQDPKALKFWKNYLNDATVTTLRYKAKTEITDSGLHNISFRLNDEEAKTLKKLADTLGITVDLIFLFAYLKTLALFSNANDVVLGITVNNRLEKEGGDSLFGLFLNVMPFRFSIDNSKSFSRNLKRLSKARVKMEKHKKIPYGYIKSIIKKDFFNFGYNFVHFHALNESLDIISSMQGYEKTNIPFTLNVSQMSNIFNISASVHDNFMDGDFLEYLMSFYKKILNEILYDSKQENYLTDLDYIKIIYDFNQTSKFYNNRKSDVLQLFQEQVKKTPSNIAVKKGKNELSYTELNEASDQLAAELLKHSKLDKDTIIILYFERSIQLLVSLLAILKTGAAYAPIDIQHPEERIRYILKDTNAHFILTDEIHEKKVGRLAREMNINSLIVGKEVIYNNYKKNSGFNKADTPIINAIKPSDLAYVLYTSGSTGDPKGVMVEHRNIVNYINNIRSFGLVAENDIVDFSTSIGFDLTLTTTLCSLCIGAKIAIFEGDVLDVDAYKTHLIEQNVTMIKLVPSYFETVMDCLPDTAIKKIVLGGEKLNPEIINKLETLYLKDANSVKVYDEYGPTECTVGACISCVYPDKNYTIGKPYFNNMAYILDKNKKPLPIGVFGELFIGGLGVSRGYLNAPSFTKEKYVDNPFSDKKNSRNHSVIYKTGDLARWLLNGNLEYLGRLDSQIKLRGYRIELKEIEEVLYKYNNISQAVTVAQKNEKGEENKIVAYIVPKSDKFSLVALRKYLFEQLPSYMIPGDIIILEKLPLTLNGKLDLGALPSLTIDHSKELICPRDNLEARIMEIWGNILNVKTEKFSIRDNFFELGGDSILCIRLIAKLRQELNLNVGVKDIFKYKSIESVYDFLVKNKSEMKVCTQFNKNLPNHTFPLLPIQEWFFRQELTNPNHFNQSFMIRVPSLNIEKLDFSINQLLLKHSSLALQFKMNEANNYVQYYDSSMTDVTPLSLLDLTDIMSSLSNDGIELELRKILTEWQSQFKITEGKLFKAGYIYGYRDNSARIWFAFHHLIIDAVSWRVLLDDLYNIYHGKEIGYQTASYYEWINAIKNYRNIFSNEISYWQGLVSDFNNIKAKPPILKLNEVNIKSKIQLDSIQTEKLLRKCYSRYNTQINDLLLTALAYALYSITAKNVNYITLEGHGREAIYETLDVSRTVGWFTTIYPVRLEITDNLSTSIKNIKETLRLIPNNGVGYGTLIGYNSENILPLVNFNYLGQFGSQTENEFWSISSEKSGTQVDAENSSKTLIDMNGLVIDKKLSFNISTRLNETDHEYFSNMFKSKLLEIIEHCSSDANTMHTISDFPDFEPFAIFHEVSEKSLFLFPPSDGGIESYVNNVVAKLDKTKLIVFNNFYLYLSGEFNEEYIQNLSFEGLAENYISYIKSIQPMGPYNLMGWSFGGVLAFEVARQLFLRGDNVETLILIDSFFGVAGITDSMGFGLRKNINYSYVPHIQKDAFDETKVVLFKAVKQVSENNVSPNDDSELVNYYTQYEEYNHLESLINVGKIERISMNHSHYSWIKNENEVHRICKKIEEVINQNILIRSGSMNQVIKELV